MILDVIGTHARISFFFFFLIGLLCFLFVVRVLICDLLNSNVGFGKGYFGNDSHTCQGFLSGTQDLKIFKSRSSFSWVLFFSCLGAILGPVSYHEMVNANDPLNLDTCSPPPPSERVLWFIFDLLGVFLLIGVLLVFMVGQFIQMDC